MMGVTHLTTAPDEAPQATEPTKANWGRRTVRNAAICCLINANKLKEEMNELWWQSVRSSSDLALVVLYSRHSPVSSDVVSHVPNMFEWLQVSTDNPVYTRRLQRWRMWRNVGQSVLPILSYGILWHYQGMWVSFYSCTKSSMCLPTMCSVLRCFGGFIMHQPCTVSSQSRRAVPHLSGERAMALSVHRNLSVNSDFSPSPCSVVTGLWSS